VGPILVATATTFALGAESSRLPACLSVFFSACVSDQNDRTTTFRSHLVIVGVLVFLAGFLETVCLCLCIEKCDIIVNCCIC